MSLEMGGAGSGGYTFDRGLPVDEIEKGASVLIKGSSKPGRKDFVFDLLRSDEEGLVDPAVLVTTNQSGEKAAQRYRSLNEGDRTHPPLGIIDCMPSSGSYSLRDAVVTQVGSPGDLTGIGVEITKMVDALNDRGHDKVRLVLDSICSITMYTDVEVLFRFLQTVISYIQTTESVGIFTIDPSSHSEETLAMVTHLFEYVLDVEEYTSFGIVDSTGFDQ